MISKDIHSAFVGEPQFRFDAPYFESAILEILNRSDETLLLHGVRLPCNN